MPATLEASNLIATLETRFYADPSLLWNAQASAGAAPTLSLVGNQLTVQMPLGATGSYQIQVAASDGKLSSTQTFTVTIKQNNTAPQIAALASASMLTNRSQTLTLSATDAQNDTITWSAKVVGTFSTAPASLVVNGNQLTIYTSPDYVGAFDVQVTASDGSLSSNTLLHVNVAAAPVANRFKGDFNRDGIQDTAYFNQDGSWWVSLNKADGSFVNQNWANWSASSNWSQIQVGDFNGDGKTDLLGIYKDGSFYLGVSTGAAFTTQFWGKWDVAANWKLLQVGDFNGDGKTDILGFYKDGTIYVGVSTGAAFSTQLWAKWSTASAWATVYVADVNGDGKVDFVGRYSNGEWYVAYSTGVAFSTQYWSAATAPANKASAK